MKKLLAFLSLVLLCLPLQAQQNLVPNGDFEQYNSCPWSFNGIDINVPFWFTPLSLSMKDSIGSSDYYHECGYNQYTPSQGFFQSRIPHSGEAFAGIFLGLFSYRKDLNNQEYYDEYREYIEVKLKDALISGKKYCFEFWYSIGYNKWDAPIYQQVPLGILLSDTLVKRRLVIYQYQNGNTDSFPQPISSMFAYQQFTPDWLDTIHWNKISGDFIANGNECYLTIGNFSPEDLISLKYVYVYIDDVSLWLCEESPAPPVGLMQVFPNPADEEVSFSYSAIPKDASAMLEILTRHGQLIDMLNLTPGESQTKINTRHFAQGVYMARLQYSSGEQASVKFIIRH